MIHHLVMGGLENGLVNLINGLPESSFRHAVACVEDASEFARRIRRRDVDVFQLHRSNIGVWRTRAELFRLCRRLEPTIVHSRNMSGLDAIIPARAAGVRHCVHGEHGWDVGDLEGREWKPALLRRLHAPFVERYVTVSKELENYLVQRIGIEPERITQIYNGVDTDRFQPRADRPVGVLPEGFVDDSSIVIGTVGRLQAVKDQATLVRAFAALVADPAMRRVVRLAIVGDGPLLSDLRSLVDSLGLASLAWLPGASANVDQVLRSFDLFVLPSLAEGISNTILEAMATGLPVIASTVGGNRELIEVGETGDAFRPGDVHALATLLARYAADASARRAMGAHSRQVAVERFGLTTMLNGYQALYEELCSNG